MRGRNFEPADRVDAPPVTIVNQALAAQFWPGEDAMGITQITEILANPGVTYCGPLPEGLQVRTVYSAGLASGATGVKAACDFYARLTSPDARAVLTGAGYEVE